jgi:hypothetical protein
VAIALAVCIALALSAQGAAAASTPALSRVTYLTLVFDGKTLTLYVNGVAAAHHAESGPADAGADTTEIGAYAGRAFWDGALDDVAVYDAALSPQRVAEHYHAGTTRGVDYEKLVKSTHGVVGYWLLDSTRTVRDSVGHARGEVVGKGIVPWYGLIAGSRNPAIALDGIGTELRITGVPTLRKAFSIEGWVLPGPKVGNRVVAGRPGAWFLRTDVLGHWSGGFFHNKHIVGVAAAITARPARAAVKSPSGSAHESAPSSGGTSPAIVIGLMVLAGLGVAAVPTLRRRRRKAGEPPPEQAPAEEPPEERAPAEVGTHAANDS